MSLLTFVTACLISSGFHEFCEKGLQKIHKELDRLVEVNVSGQLLHTILLTIMLLNILCQTWKKMLHVK